MNKDDAHRTSIAQLVRDTLQMRPSLRDALQMKVVNYSALARLLQQEIEEGSLEAVKAAVIRVAEELEAVKSTREEAVRSILKKSKVRLHDKIAVLISPQKLDLPYIVTAYLTDSYVYIVDQTTLKKEIPKNVNIQTNLIALILLSPPIVESTPGFVSLITQLLASHNLNIIEFISCATNTIIILNSKDALVAFSLLQNFT